MGVQVFQGLATHPELAPFIPEVATYAEPELNWSSSFRAQLRGETGRVTVAEDDGSLGMRVDTPPLGVSEAASAANERGITAVSMDVDGICM